MKLLMLCPFTANNYTMQEWSRYSTCAEGRNFSFFSQDIIGIIFSFNISNIFTK